MGTVWDVDAGRQQFATSCSEITWHRANIDIEEFEKETSSLTFSKGVGLAGKVWESGEPAWMPRPCDAGRPGEYRHRRKERYAIRILHPHQGAE